MKNLILACCLLFSFMSNGQEVRFGDPSTPYLNLVLEADSSTFEMRSGFFSAQIDYSTQSDEMRFSKNGVSFSLRDSNFYIPHLGGADANLRIDQNGRVYSIDNLPRSWAFGFVDFLHRKYSYNIDQLEVDFNYEGVSGSSNIGNELYAPVKLPHGVFLDDMEVYFLDTNPNCDLHVSLNIFDITNGSSIGPSIQSSGQNMVFQTQSTSLNHTVDNSRYVYFLVAIPRIGCSWTNADGKIRLRAVVLKEGN